MRHGETSAEFELLVWLGPDPQLALVYAPLHDVCVCDESAGLCPCAGDEIEDASSQPTEEAK